MQKNLLAAITGAISAYIELGELSATMIQQQDTWWMLGQRRQKECRTNSRELRPMPGPGAWRYRIQG